MCFVQLLCDSEELARRVTNKSRREMKKLVSKARLAALMNGMDIISEIPNAKSLKIDTTQTKPAAVAKIISDFYGLTGVWVI